MCECLVSREPLSVLHATVFLVCEKTLTKIISFGYILYCGCFNFFCNMWVGVCMCGFCNVWVFW